MIRVKTFDATGIAPGGRLFAGDLNAIEDAAAGQSDLTQNIQTGTLAVGESGLQLLRYGAGEARLSGLLRTDGLIRALGGIAPGTFTTTQRDDGVSIPLGKRPYGGAIVNSTSNQWEWNKGTDAVPVWAAIGGAPSTRGILSVIPAATAVVPGSFYYATDQDTFWQSNGTSWVRVSSQAGDLFLTLNAVASIGRILLQGQTVSRAGLNADLFAKWGTTFGAGDGSTTFGLPDMRGRIPVALGTHGDVNAVGKNEGVAVGSRRPAHKHTHSLSINGGSHGHSLGDDRGASAGITLGNGGASSGTSTIDDSQCNFSFGMLRALAAMHTHPTGEFAGGIGPQTGAEPTDNAAFFVVNVEAKL